MGSQSKPTASPRILFGPFSYDLASGDLSKHGTRVRLQGQPLLILSALLERPGQIVTREDLKQQIWQDSTFGDFEHGLNAAVNKLRQALGDSADKPRYIETLPGRGYRFIAPVQRPSLTPILAMAPVGDPEASGMTQPAPRSIWLPWVVAGALAISSLVLSLFLWRAPRPVGPPLVRLSVDLPEFAVTPELSPGASVILSPDGKRIVYTGHSPNGAFRLYTRTLDQEQAAPLAGTDGAYGPFFSPDGQTVGFFAGGKLKKISLQGGPAVVLCNASTGVGASWGEDGNIIVAPDIFGGFLWRIPSGGGTLQPVTKLKPELNEHSHVWPQVLPGAQAVLFTTVVATGTIGESNRIEVQSLRTGQRKTLLRSGQYGRYLPSGHLLYLHHGTLYAAPMDAKRLELTGSAVPVVENVMSGNVAGFAQVDFSRNGTLVYIWGKVPRQTLLWLDSTAQTKPLRATAAEYFGSVDFSPDGKRLAFGLAEGGSANLWVYERQRDIVTRLTFTPGFDIYPVWSPDGKHIVFSSSRHGVPNLYWIRADGAGKEAVRLTESKNPQYPRSFSPDGKRLAFNEIHPQTNYDLWTLPLEGAESDRPKPGQPEPFLVTPFDELAPMISPNGRWLAYSSNESGRSEIYVKPFPVPGGKWQISTGGGNRPVWSRKGPELFYRSMEGIMVASYTANGEAFVASKPHLWASHKDLGPFFDLAPDGKRFAVVEAEASEPKEPTRVTFVLNFFDELRRRAPVGGK